MKQQLALGDFVFSLANKTAYEQFSRQSSGGWVNIDITNAKPRSHNTGQGLETITISGQCFGGDGMDTLDKLRTMQSLRKPQTLVDGLGRNLGRWKIMNITETQKRIIDDGTAMVLSFNLLLEEFVGEIS
jgi:phage protein U